MLVVSKILILALGVLLLAGIVTIIVLAIAGAGKSKETKGDESYFDGGTLQLIGWRILASLLTTITFGFAFPWAMCMLQRWEVKHTVINGRRLKFTGKGVQLFGRYILWSFLTVITFGIYSIWFGLGMKKWVVKHTVYADDSSEFESNFTGGAGGWFVNHMLIGIAGMFTFGIAVPWAQVHLMKWEAEHTVINGSPLVFEGTGGQLFVKNLLLGILTPITFGIYAIFYPVKILKWQYSKTQALYRTMPIQKLAHEHEEAANVDFAKFGLNANETELMMLRSGIKGDETYEQLEELANAGNPYAMYMISQVMEDKEKAQEYIRLSASAKYHPALLKYAQNFANTDEMSFKNNLEESARCGNTVAPWVLKSFYENKARGIKKSKEAIPVLKNSAYWFKIAIEQNHPDAVQARGQYDKMVENIAIRIANDKAKTKGVGAGIVVAIVAGIMAMILALGAIMAIFGIGFKTPFARPKQASTYANENVFYPTTANGQSQSSFYFERIIEEDENTTFVAMHYNSKYPAVNEYLKTNYAGADYGDNIFDALKQRTIYVRNDFSNAYVSYRITFNIHGADDYVKEILVYDASSKKFTVVDDLSYEGIISNNATQKLYILIIVKVLPQDKFTSWRVEYEYEHLGFLSEDQVGDDGANAGNNASDEVSADPTSSLTLDKAEELVNANNVSLFLIEYFDDLNMLDKSKHYKLYIEPNDYYVDCYGGKGITTIDDLKSKLTKHFTEAYINKHFIRDGNGFWHIKDNMVFFEPNWGLGPNYMLTETIKIESIGKNMYKITADTEFDDPESIYVSYENGDYKIDVERDNTGNLILSEYTAWHLILDMYEIENRTYNFFGVTKGMLDLSKTYTRQAKFSEGMISLKCSPILGIKTGEDLREFIHQYCTADYHLAFHDNPSQEEPTTDFMSMWFMHDGVVHVSEQYDYPWRLKDDGFTLVRNSDGTYTAKVYECAAGDYNGKAEKEYTYTFVLEDGLYKIDSRISRTL